MTYNVLVSCVEQSDSSIYIYIYFFSFIFFSTMILQDLEYSSLCYAIGPCCLFTLYIIVHMLIQNSQFIPPLSSPLSIYKFVLCVFKFVSVLYIITFVSCLDCTYKQYRTVIVSPTLTMISWHDSKSEGNNSKSK